MKPGDIINLYGYVTQEKDINGRTLREMESILGYHNGRLSQGAIILELTKLPLLH